MRKSDIKKEWFAVARKVDAMIERYGLRPENDWTECKIQTMQADEFKRMADAVMNNRPIAEYMEEVTALWA